jgi:multidrug resistance efflux pump
VQSVLVDVGSYVKRGDVLATLKNSDLKANLELIKTELKYAKKDYARVKRAQSVIDKAQIDKFAFKKDIAQAKIKVQQEMIAKTVLKAPFDGVIYYKNIEAGDVVSGMNPRVVFKLQSKSSTKLIISFDQKWASVVKVGDTFKYKLSNSSDTKSVKITKIYPTIDTKSRKVIAQAVSSGEFVGMFGDGYIEVNR